MVTLPRKPCEELLGDLHATAAVVIQIIGYFPVGILYSPNVLFTVFILTLLLIVHSDLFGSLITEQHASGCEKQLPERFLKLAQLLHVPLYPGQNGRGVETCTGILETVYDPFKRQTVLVFVNQNAGPSVQNPQDILQGRSQTVCGYHFCL